MEPRSRIWSSQCTVQSDLRQRHVCFASSHGTKQRFSCDECVRKLVAHPVYTWSSSDALPLVKARAHVAFRKCSDCLMNSFSVWTQDKLERKSLLRAAVFDFPSWTDWSWVVFFSFLYEVWRWTAGFPFPPWIWMFIIFDTSFGPRDISRLLCDIGMMLNRVARPKLLGFDLRSPLILHNVARCVTFMLLPFSASPCRGQIPRPRDLAKYPTASVRWHLSVWTKGPNPQIEGNYITLQLSVDTSISSFIPLTSFSERAAHMRGGVAVGSDKQ